MNKSLDSLIDQLIDAPPPPDVFPPPGDFHSVNTAAFFGFEESKAAYQRNKLEYKEEFRGIGKIAGLALVYGSSYKLFLDIIPNCTEAQAMKIYNAFFSGLPVFTRYDKYMLKFARKNGYIKTLLQRVLYIDNLHSDNWGLKAKGEREVKNYPIQGMGSEIIKYLLLKLFNFIDEHKLSRWVGTYIWSNYYTRILTVKESDVTDELISDLESQPKGNCKILVVSDDGSILQEWDKPVQMNLRVYNRHKFEVIL